MIKKILFITAIVSASFASAQTFQLLDKNDVDISGTNHTIYGNPQDLAETKLHVKNVTGSSATFTMEVQEVTNAPASDLQVCYGILCFVATQGISTFQTNTGSVPVAAGATYNDSKPAPFSFGWTNGQSATWRIRIVNTQDVTDSTSAVVTYSTFAVGIDEVSENDVAMKVYPNPAVNKINISYAIDINTNNAQLSVFDVVGKKVKSYTLADNKGELNINVNDLNSGVYFYSIMVEGKAIKTERVIVK